MEKNRQVHRRGFSRKRIPWRTTCLPRLWTASIPRTLHESPLYRCSCYTTYVVIIYGIL